MKPLILALIAAVAFAPSTRAAEKVDGDLARLQGTWVTEAGANKKVRVVLRIEGHAALVRLTMPNGGKFQAKGEVKLDESASPKAWDWIKFTGLDGQELPEIPAIYELKGDTLRVCNGGPDNERPSEFKPGDGALADVHLFRRLEKTDDQAAR
jgi:uncharacterized protein (TIGR03067 family)